MAIRSASAWRCAMAAVRSATSCRRWSTMDIGRILVAPLYPQYCGATTASAMDAVFNAAASDARRSRRSGRCRLILTIRSTSARSRPASKRQLAALDFTPDRLLLSFHGMPERTRPLGDPYYDQCQATARLLGEATELAGRRRLPVALRQGEMAGAGDRRDARRLSGAGGEDGWPSPRPAFPPTAWKRWRSSASAGAKPSCRPAAPILPGSIASTTATRGWRCSTR